VGASKKSIAGMWAADLTSGVESAPVARAVLGKLSEEDLQAIVATVGG
jgi:hypothetical protein